MPSAPPEIVTAAVLVIGDEILSGRTKDCNIGYIAEYLAKIGVDLREARVVPDIEEEIVVALNALRGGEAVRPHTHHDGLDALTPRERRVLQTVVANKVRTNRDLAKILFISESTLRNHLSSIYQKLGVSNRLDLYVYAQSHLVTNAAAMA